MLKRSASRRPRRRRSHGEHREEERRGARGLAAPQPPLGPGDDAAVVPAPDGRVVATTDLLVEGRHFRLDWSSPADVGYKAAAQNLADVAAMGARPTALVVGLSAPASACGSETTSTSGMTAVTSPGRLDDTAMIL